MRLRRHYTDGKGQLVDEWATSQVAIDRTGEEPAVVCEWQSFRDLERGASRIPMQAPSEDLEEAVAMLDADARERGGRARLVWLGGNPTVLGGGEPASPLDRIREHRAEAAAKAAEEDRRAQERVRDQMAALAEEARRERVRAERAAERKKAEERKAAELEAKEADKAARRAVAAAPGEPQTLGAEDVGELPAELLGGGG